jgi:acetyltransferase-like isoleucine patch superfamily enzyme
MKQKLFKAYLLLVKLVIRVNSGVKLGDASVRGFPLFRVRGSLQLGKGSRLNSGLYWNPIGGDARMCIVVDAQAKLSVGDNFAASNCSIFCRQSILIGKNVMVGGGARIWDTDFHDLSIKKRMLPLDRGKSKPIVIGDNVFVGANSIILKGVVIGNNAVLGAGSVVSCNVPSHEVWAGNPARFIRKLDDC